MYCQFINIYNLTIIVAIGEQKNAIVLKLYWFCLNCIFSPHICQFESNVKKYRTFLNYTSLRLCNVSKWIPSADSLHLSPPLPSSCLCYVEQCEHEVIDCSSRVWKQNRGLKKDVNRIPEQSQPALVWIRCEHRRHASQSLFLQLGFLTNHLQIIYYIYVYS